MTPLNSMELIFAAIQSIGITIIAACAVYCVGKVESKIDQPTGAERQSKSLRPALSPRSSACVSPKSSS